MNKILHYIKKFFLNGYVFSIICIVAFLLIPTYACTYFVTSMNIYVLLTYVSGMICGCIITLKDEYKYRDKAIEICNKKLKEQEEYWKAQMENLGIQIVKKLQNKEEEDNKD